MRTATSCSFFSPFPDQLASPYDSCQPQASFHSGNTGLPDSVLTFVQLSLPTLAAMSAAATPPMSSSQTRRHPASLIPKFMHDPALLELVRSPVTPEMICE